MAKHSRTSTPRQKNRQQDAAAPAVERVAWLRRHGAWLGLLALALVAYLPALRAGFIWDDQAMCENPLISAPGGLGSLWTPGCIPREAHYWPLVYTTFWLECRLWGLNPLGYHLVNVLLHGVCGVLVWRVLRHLEVPGAWLGAALFAVHPVHVESVAWVIERKDVLSGALYLGAALAYLKFAEHRSHKSYGTYCLALALFTLAMLSKSIVVTLPLALGLVIWWKRGRLGWRDIAPLLPLALIAGAVTLFDLRQLHEIPVFDLALSLTQGDKLRLAGQTLWFYLGKLAWPHPLVTLYPKWDVAAAGGLGGWLPLGAAAALAVLLWALRRRLGHGPLVAALYFGLTLGPVLGLVKFDFLKLAWAADRFQYLASIGPLALLGATIWKYGIGIPSNVKGQMSNAGKTEKEAGLAKRTEVGREACATPFRNPHSAFRISVSVLIAILGLLTFRQAGVYRDIESLCRHNLAHYPQNWIVNFFLGNTREILGKDEQAAEAFAEALRLRPEGSAVIPLHLARLQARLGRADEAARTYQDGVRRHPADAELRNEYGSFLADQGKVEEALAQYHEALRLRPRYAEALAGLGSLLSGQGRFEEAAARLTEAVALSPGSAPLRTNLAAALVQAGHPAEGVAQLREAVRLDPRLFEARVNLGTMLLSQGDRAGAAEQLSEALRLRPDHAETARKLAQCRQNP